MAMNMVNPVQPPEKKNKLGLALDALNLGLKGVDTYFDLKGPQKEEPKDPLKREPKKIPYPDLMRT